MGPTAGDPELLNHFSVVIYPFLHDLTGRDPGARLRPLGARWEPWWSRLDDDEAALALEGTGFFLPYIRGLLYPETVRLGDEPPGPRYANWVRRLRRYCGAGLGSFRRRLPDDSILRLTCREGVRAPLADFTVREVGRPRPADFTIPTLRDHTDLPGSLEWADVLLFPSGLGFLLLKVHLRGERPRLSQLIRFNQALRLVHPPSLAWTLPVLRFAGGEEVHVGDLMDFLTQGLVGDLLPGEEFAAGPLAGGSPDRNYSETEAGRAYGERCPVLSYACVHLGEAERGQLPAGAFASVEDRLLFEFAAGIGPGQSVRDPTWAPAPEQAERVTRENRLAIWRCWRAMAFKECLIFLGTEDLAFNRKALPHNVEHHYLPLYLYTLYQKFQLTTFADDLMWEVAQGDRRLSGARGLQDRLVSFRNRYWFHEVTRKPLGGDLHRTLQRGLEVPALYEMVIASVKDAKEYYEALQVRKTQWLRAVLGHYSLLVAVVTAAATSVHAYVAGSAWRWVGGALAVVAAGGAAALFLLRRGSDRRGRTGFRRPRRQEAPGSKTLPKPGRRDRVDEAVSA